MSNRMRGVNPRTNLKAVVNTRRGLKGATTLPKAYLAAGVATMGAMTYLVLRDGSSGARKEQQQQPPPPSAAAASSSNASAPFLTLDGQAVSAANVPKYVLANSGLDQEQKLQVALCRRQAWLRASQYAPMAALWSYAACVLTEHSGLAKLPRGSRTGVPLAAAVIGGTLGAYVGGLEGKPMMNAALMATPIENVHKPRSQRPKEEDALVHFIREARDGKAVK